MSILAKQNINNLLEDFTSSNRNPFLVSEGETAQPYWDGYEYAPPGLGTAFVATTAADRLNPIGEEMFNDGSGEAQYSPVGKMSDSQTSILSGLADMLNTNQEAGGAQSGGRFSTGKTGPTQMQATFAKSKALRSTNIVDRVVGGQATTSGTPVPQFTTLNPYGVSYTPLVSFAESDSSVTVDGESAGNLDTALASGVFGDLDASGTADFDDFFIWADTAENKDGIISGGGIPWVNMTPVGTSNQMGIQTILGINKDQE